MLYLPSECCCPVCISYYVNSGQKAICYNEELRSMLLQSHVSPAASALILQQLIEVSPTTKTLRQGSRCFF